MKDYVFPTTDQGEKNSSPAIPSIDWSEVETRLAQVATPKAASAEVTELIKSAGSADHLKDFQFKSKDENSKDADDKKTKEEDKDEDDDFVKHGKEASAKRKVVFSSKDQISPAALAKAKADGDTELYQTILAARHEHRMSLAKKAEAIAGQIATTNSRLAQRAAFRENLVKQAASAAKAATKTASQKVAQAQAPSAVFVPPSQLSDNAKAIFAQKAASLGFSPEYTQAYVTAMLGTTEEVANTDSEAIIAVMNSNMTVEAKKNVVKTMVRSAELSKEDETRLRKYWVDDLKYDAAWVEELLASYKK